MNFFKKIFNKKEKAISSYADFWTWFVANEKKFHKVVKEQGDLNTLFFEKLSPKLNELKDGFWFLVGMYDENTAELILTADGIIPNIVFIEELVAAAPPIKNWKITALKQPASHNQYSIKTDGYLFDETTMNFYAIDHADRPDEITIIITHKDFTEENKSSIANGVYLALDNTLGELNSVTTIDELRVINTADAEKKLIPIEKLKAFLLWREKEFVEKYEGFRHNAASDNYVTLRATLQNNLPLLAIINTDILTWDRKASHPWVVVVEIKYDGENNNGMPTEDTYNFLNEIEDEIMEELKDFDGYLNIGRQTADGSREIYFACVDFRKPSKILYQTQQKYKEKNDFKYTIYKDKYWQSFHRFMMD